MADPYGGERFGLALAAVIRPDQFGVNWNNPLPSGEPALSDDVTLIPKSSS
jgi:polyisoprenoid-binding protein YceI